MKRTTSTTSTSHGCTMHKVKLGCAPFLVPGLTHGSCNTIMTCCRDSCQAGAWATMCHGAPRSSDRCCTGAVTRDQALFWLALICFGASLVILYLGLSQFSLAESLGKAMLDLSTASGMEASSF